MRKKNISRCFIIHTARSKASNFFLIIIKFIIFIQRNWPDERKVINLINKQLKRMDHVQTKKDNNKRKICWSSIHFNSGSDSVRTSPRTEQMAGLVFFLCIGGDCVLVTMLG